MFTIKEGGIMVEVKEQDILDGMDDKRKDPKFDGLIGFVPFAFHLVPLKGLAKVAAVMRKGERNLRDGWREIPTEEHLNHAISHIVAYLAGKHEDHHLANAGCRILMALDLDKKEALPKPRPEMKRPGLGQRQGQETEPGLGQSNVPLPQEQTQDQDSR